MEDAVLKYGTKYVTKKLSSEAFWRRHWIVSCALGTIGATCLGRLLNYFYEWYRLSRCRTDKEESARVAKEKLKEHLADLKTKSSVDWDWIVSLTFSDLNRKLHARELKAVDVLHAFQWKALEDDARVNCVTEPIFEAEILATECDLSDKILGPLHGMPVTLSESLPVVGYASTGGASKYVADASEDCVLVDVLKELGAVPFAKTNVPQFPLSYNCSNPIFGRTVNPHDSSRSAGVGGAALVASGGSVLGLELDVVGGTLTGAAMCGAASFKPTAVRLSRLGLHSSSRIPPLLQPSVAPVAKSVHGLVTTVESLFQSSMPEKDRRVPPVRFQSDLFNGAKKLRIGYYDFDGYVQPIPACERAVWMAKEALKRKGHTFVPWKPPRVKYAMQVLLQNAMFGDHGRNFLKELGHDQIDPSARQVYYVLMIPEFFRKILANMLRPQSPFIARVLSVGLRLRSVYDFWMLSAMFDEYREEFVKDWQSAKLDAVVCPGLATAALPHNVEIGAVSSYTALFSLVDLPVGSVPITTVTSEDDVMLEVEYETSDTVGKLVKRFAAGSGGLPVSVQCVCLPWQDELCLRVMSELEGELQRTKVKK